MSWPLFVVLLFAFTFGLAYSGFAWLVEATFRYAGTGLLLALAGTAIFLVLRGIRALLRPVATGARALFLPARADQRATTRLGATAPVTAPAAAPARHSRAKPRNVVRRPPAPGPDGPGV